MTTDAARKDFARAQHDRLSSDLLRCSLKVQSTILKAAADFLHDHDFVQILPVIMSPITDPLRHATGKAEVEYYEQRYQLTRSMILHKQMMLLAHDRIFAFSPNIRLEPVELADTGRHLAEFTQLDLEMKGASRDAAMELAEDLIIAIMTSARKECAAELKFLKRELTVPRKPFERITYREAYDRYGGNFEAIVSQDHRDPVWIIDIASQVREFYDREDPTHPGVLVDMDLLYPEGYGEALSGGEREHEADRLHKRMQASGLDPEFFRTYLDLAGEGLPPSAGFGIGMERMTRFLCGRKRIEDVVHFPKVPGELSL